MRKQRALAGLRSLSVPVLVVGMALVLAACADIDDVADDGDVDEVDADQPDDEPDDVGGPTNEPVTFGLSTEVDVLDPQQFKNDTSFIVSAALVGTLITEEYEETADGTYVATGNFRSSIAEYPPEYSDDGLTVTFKINQGAEFEDGTPITAQDWEWTWQRIFDGPGYISLLLPIIGIESADAISALDDETLVIERAFDSPMFEPFMASPCCFGVLSQAAAEEHGGDDEWAGEWYQRNMVSSGPMRIESWAEGESIVLVPNEGSPEFEHVQTSMVELVVTPSVEDRIALLRGGAIDVAIDLPLRDVQRLEEDDSLNIHSFDGRRIHYLGFNLQEGPFADRNLREAVQKAVPYDLLISNVMFGYGQQPESVLSVGMPGYKPTLPAERDLDAAREALERSDYAGQPLPLSVRQSQPLDQDAAILIQDALREIGLEIQIEIVPDATFQEQIGQRQLPFFVMDWQSLGNDGFYQLQWVAQSASPINYTGFASDEMDQLIADGVPEGDSNAREELLWEAQDVFAEEIPWVPLFQPNTVVVAGADVAGVNDFYDPLRRIEFLHKVQ